MLKSTRGGLTLKDKNFPDFYLHNMKYFNTFLLPKIGEKIPNAKILKVKQNLL